jgi:signal transduction histidine kinase
MLVTNQLKFAQQNQPGATLKSIGPTLSENLRLIKESTLAGIRITDDKGVVIATSGTVLGEDLRGDAEIQRALAGQLAVTTKPRGSPSKNPISSRSRRANVRMFVAVPIALNGDVLGTIVLSRTPREELQALYHMSSTKALVATLSALMATLWVGLYAGYLLTRSLGIVAVGTGQIAEGNFDEASAMALTEQSHVADVARLARSVRAMSGRLRQRLSYISEFASNVSHEFKTPLATLRGTLERSGALGDRELMMVYAQAFIREQAPRLPFWGIYGRHYLMAHIIL